MPDWQIEQPASEGLLLPPNVLSLCGSALLMCWKQRTCKHSMPDWNPSVLDWCAKVLPTSGSRSISVWDVDSIESFQHWLDETMEADCESEVFEVPC